MILIWRIFRDIYGYVFNLFNYFNVFALDLLGENSLMFEKGFKFVVLPFDDNGISLLLQDNCCHLKCL
jgi:hypothetical protein